MERRVSLGPGSGPCEGTADKRAEAGPSQGVHSPSDSGPWHPSLLVGQDMFTEHCMGDPLLDGRDLKS